MVRNKFWYFFYCIWESVVLFRMIYTDVLVKNVDRVPTGIKFISSDQNIPLQWHHNGRDSISNHQRLDSLLNRLFSRIRKKTSKLCVTGLCVWNSPVTGEFPVQRASNAENGPIWWRHHALFSTTKVDRRNHYRINTNLQHIINNLRTMFSQNSNKAYTYIQRFLNNLRNTPRLVIENSSTTHKTSTAWQRNSNDFYITWASYQIHKIANCACAGNVFPATDFKGNS